MIATGDFLTALECTKFDFGRSQPRTPLGSLQRPQTHIWFKGPTSKGMGGKGTGNEERKGGEEVRERQETGGWKGRGRDARERGGKERGREGGKGRKVRTPLHQFQTTPLHRGLVSK